MIPPEEGFCIERFSSVAEHVWSGTVCSINRALLSERGCLHRPVSRGKQHRLESACGTSHYSHLPWCVFRGV